MRLELTFHCTALPCHIMLPPAASIYWTVLKSLPAVVLCLPAVSKTLNLHVFFNTDRSILLQSLHLFVHHQNKVSVNTGSLSVCFLQCQNQAILLVCSFNIVYNLAISWRPSNRWHHKCIIMLPRYWVSFNKCACQCTWMHTLWQK